MKKTLSLFIIIPLILFACTPVSEITIIDRNIFYTGDYSGVKVALLQAGYTLVDDFTKVDVFVLNGEIPDVNAIATKLQDGAGLILISGEEMSFREVKILVDYPVSGLFESESPISLAVDEFFGKNDPLITEIDWTDAPQIRERAPLFTPAPGKVFLRVDGCAEPVFGEIGQPAERKFFISAFLDVQHNLQFQGWEYFTYTIYHLVERAAGAEPLNFADYETLTREH
jgi:hypothetical protein